MRVRVGEYVYERESVCMRERESVCMRERESVCVCVYPDGRLCDVFHRSGISALSFGSTFLPGLLVTLSSPAPSFPFLLCLPVLLLAQLFRLRS